MPESVRLTGYDYCAGGVSLAFAGESKSCVHCIVHILQWHLRLGTVLKSFLRGKSRGGVLQIHKCSPQTGHAQVAAPLHHRGEFSKTATSHTIHYQYAKIVLTEGEITRPKKKHPCPFIRNSKKLVDLYFIVVIEFNFFFAAQLGGVECVVVPKQHPIRGFGDRDVRITQHTGVVCGEVI